MRALTPSTVVSLRREELERLIMNKPEVGLRLIRDLAEKLHASETRYAGIIGKDVPARLATLILMLVDSEGVMSSESYRIPTHYTHEQLGLHDRLQAGGGNPRVPQARRWRGGTAQGSAHRGQGHRCTQRSGRGRLEPKGERIFRAIMHQNSG